MRRAQLQNALARAAGFSLAIAMFSGAAFADPYVEFDFARSAECRDVTPAERVSQYPNQRLVEFVIPISVRFRGVPLDDVDELTVEINGAAAGLRIYGFAPATQLASDVAREIETTTTTKSARSLDATLGGQLPVPYGELAANVAPSISGGISGGETTTEKLNRLPPKYAVVVSGTSSEGRGVFFKLKRFSQTSLEGVHELAVTFVAPAAWRGGDVRVSCNAQGQRKVFWIKQDASLGSEGDTVRLYLAGNGRPRVVAKPVVVEAPPAKKRPTALEAAARDVVGAVEAAQQDRPKWIGKYKPGPKGGDWNATLQATNSRLVERPEDGDQDNRDDAEDKIQ